MNKKILVTTIAILALIMMVAISPVMAIEKETWWSHAYKWVVIEPGEQWVSEEGILHTKDRHNHATYECTVGTGTAEQWITVSMDLATGEGTLHAKMSVTITSGMTGSFELSITGKVYGYGALIEGKAVGHGTAGELEGIKMTFSFVFSGGHTWGTGTITYH